MAELIKEVSLRGVDTRLSTNGIYLTKEKLYEIRNYLNKVY